MDGVRSDGLSEVVYPSDFADDNKASFDEALHKHYYGHRAAAADCIEKALARGSLSSVESSWFLILRCIVDVQQQIRHVPKVLEHRVHERIGTHENPILLVALWSYDILMEETVETIEHIRVFDGKPTKHAARDMETLDFMIALVRMFPVPTQGMAHLTEIEVSRKILV